MTIPNLTYHHFKAPCRLATAGTSIDLTSTTDPGNIDGVSLNDGDRILLKDQSTASENGPYVANTATDPSTWERAFDANASPLVNAGMTLSVSEGSENSDTTWQLSTDDPITLGSTGLAFSELGGGASGITADAFLDTRSFTELGPISSWDLSGEDFSVDFSEFALTAWSGVGMPFHEDGSERWSCRLTRQTGSRIEGKISKIDDANTNTTGDVYDFTFLAFKL